MHTDADACDCTRGLYGHRKRVHRKSTLGAESLAAQKTRTRVSITPGFSVGRSTNWAIAALFTLYVITKNNAADGAIVCICLLDRSFIVNQHKEQS